MGLNEQSVMMNPPQGELPKVRDHTQMEFENKKHKSPNAAKDVPGTCIEQYND